MKKVVLFEDFNEKKDITDYLISISNGDTSVFYKEGPLFQEIYDSVANKALTNDRLEFECYLETLHYRIKFEVECYFDTPQMRMGETDRFPHKDDIPDYSIVIDFTPKEVFKQNAYSLSILYGKATEDNKGKLLDEANREGIKIDINNNYKNLRSANSLLDRIGSTWNRPIKFYIHWHDIKEQDFNYELCKIFGYEELCE